MERGGRREGSKIRPLPLRRMLYARVLQLRQEGLTHRKIQTKIAEELGVSISLSMISCWIRGVHTPFRDGCGRPAEDQRLRRVRPCPELAYVIGAVLGDGYTHYQGPHHYAVVLAVKDRDFAEEFSRCAAVALCRDKPRRPYWNDYMNLWYVNPCSKQLYMLLKGKDIDKVRPFIEHCSDCVHAFIRGLADAEGWVDIHIRKCRIYIVNTDRRLMEYTADLLKRLGIHATIYRRRMREIVVTRGKIYKRRHETLYILTIYRKDALLQFKQLIGFAIRRKQERLETATQTTPLSYPVAKPGREAVATRPLFPLFSDT